MNEYISGFLIYALNVIYEHDPSRFWQITNEITETAKPYAFDISAQEQAFFEQRVNEERNGGN